jgi:hypothetical protein
MRLLYLDPVLGIRDILVQKHTDLDADSEHWHIYIILQR